MLFHNKDYILQTINGLLEYHVFTKLKNMPSIIVQDKNHCTVYTELNNYCTWNTSNILIENHLLHSLSAFQNEKRNLKTCFKTFQYKSKFMDFQVEIKNMLMYVDLNTSLYILDVILSAWVIMKSIHNTNTDPQAHSQVTIMFKKKPRWDEQSYHCLCHH